MLLQELTTLPKTDDNLAAALRYAQDAGKIKLSSGTFAFVIERPGKDYVYRVWSHDKGYDRFMRYLDHEGRSEHLIRRLSKVRQATWPFKQERGTPATISFVKLERLEPLGGSTALARTIDSFFHVLASKRPKKLTTAIDLAIDYSLEEERAQETFVAHKDLFAELWKLYTLSDTKSIGFDAGSHNVMLRGATPVITDPLASYKIGSTLVST